jgi:hypothetical protein
MFLSSLCGFCFRDLAASVRLLCELFSSFCLQKVVELLPHCGPCLPLLPSVVWLVCSLCQLLTHVPLCWVVSRGMYQIFTHALGCVGMYQVLSQITLPWGCVSCGFGSGTLTHQSLTRLPLQHVARTGGSGVLYCQIDGSEQVIVHDASVGGELRNVL